MSQKLSSSRTSWIRELLTSKRARDTERVFVVEGEKPVRELVTHRQARILSLVHTFDAVRLEQESWITNASAQGVPVFSCDESQFGKLSQVDTAQGILAVVEQPTWDEAAVFSKPSLLGVYGECIQDPANVAGLIRTSEALGVDALWLSAGSADWFSPKVVRGSGGALWTLPVFALNDLLRVKDHGCQLWAATLPSKTSQSLRSVAEIPPRLILAVGNESRGLSDSCQANAEHAIHIPMEGTINSLNVSIAAAILLFQLKGCQIK